MAIDATLLNLAYPKNLITVINFLIHNSTIMHLR